MQCHKQNSVHFVEHLGRIELYRTEAIFQDIDLWIVMWVLAQNPVLFPDTFNV